jgi:hypothetical protein
MKCSKSRFCVVQRSQHNLKSNRNHYINQTRAAVSRHCRDFVLIRGSFQRTALFRFFQGTGWQRQRCPRASREPQTRRAPSGTNSSCGSVDGSATPSQRQKQKRYTQKLNRLTQFSYLLMGTHAKAFVVQPQPETTAPSRTSQPHKA